MGRVRAKFRCQGVTKRVGWGANPFTYGAEFSTVTSDLFEPGKEYYIDFIPAESE